VAGGGTVEITCGCGRGCQFCSPDLLAFRRISQKTGYPAGGRGAGQKRPAGHLPPPLRRRAVLRTRRLGSFDVNHDAIVDLFTSVRKNTRAYWASGPTFLPARRSSQPAPMTVKDISESMGIDGKNHPGYVEMGLETVSPHLVKSIICLARSSPTPLKNGPM
jgi:hypothetical protein